jgi:hypothetical protein
MSKEKPNRGDVVSLFSLKRGDRFYKNGSAAKTPRMVIEVESSTRGDVRAVKHQKDFDKKHVRSVTDYPVVYLRNVNE